MLLAKETQQWTSEQPWPLIQWGCLANSSVTATSIFSSLSHQDLTALAKELRAVEDVRPPHKVTDYSSSSEESGTTDEEDDDMEQEGADESTSGPDDVRAVLVLWFASFGTFRELKETDIGHFGLYISSQNHRIV